jgi:hypothetical protein
MVLPNALNKECNMQLIKKFYESKSFTGQSEIFAQPLDSFITDIRRRYESET